MSAKICRHFRSACGYAAMDTSKYGGTFDRIKIVLVRFPTKTGWAVYEIQTFNRRIAPERQKRLLAVKARWRVIAIYEGGRETWRSAFVLPAQPKPKDKVFPTRGPSPRTTKPRQSRMKP